MKRIFTCSRLGSFMIWSLILLFVTPGMAQFTRNNNRKSVPYRTNYQRGSSSSGSWHTFEIRDGELWGWGRNEHGQLGDGTTTQRTSPVRIGLASNWVSVVSTSNHSVGLRNDGTLWTWGYNGQGQLGNGTTTGSINPIQVGSENNWVSIGGGVGHSIALKSNGTLWAWGWNAGGQLGLGDNTDRSTPVQIGTDNNWIFLVAGVQHNLAIKSNGTLWAWGNNNENQLGDGTNTNRNVPTQVGSDNTWIAADGGEHGSIALRANGTLWSWGENQFGQVGDGSTTARSTPVQVGTDNNWVFISAGQYQNHAIKSTGTLWAWGRNNSGQLGDGSTTDRTSPVQIGSASNWVGVFGGDEFCIGLTSTGRLLSWGANNFGQLGNGTTTNSSNPIEISSQLNHWLMVAGSIWNNHSVALRSNGTIWAWGQNNSGQIGDNTTTNRNSAVQVGTDTTWISVAAGGQHSLALKSDGTVWAWGLNNNGQIGNNTTTNQTTPIQVGTDNTWISISAGETFSLGLKANGTIWYWGFGSSGNGNGGTTNSMVPVQVGSVTNWANMDAGHQHVHAIKTDGTLWAWGNNGNGQLGTGNSSNQSSPVQIGSATTWNSVSGGTHFTMGLLANGTIQNWGRNQDGQLGRGNTTWTTAPNQMGNDDNWILVNSGFAWSFGIKSTGTLWGWGQNGNGQLGDGATSNRTSPVQVDGDNLWTNISGANNHSIGLKIARSKYCATGANSSGQLGNGTTTQSTTFSCTPPDPAVPNNVIGASQTLCGPQVPAPFTGTIPTGCSGSYTYQWFSSTNNSAWTNIAGATSIDLTLGTVSATTYYRRTVSSFGCSSTSSNSVSITVTFLGNNSIISSQSICTGSSPASLIGTTPTGGSGVYTYQWESSSDNSTWANTAGSTTINFSPGTLTSNIYFRRLVSGTGCTVITSNSVSIAVSTLANNTVSSAQTICQNTATVALTGATPIGGNGIYSFQWESSANNSTWSSIPGGVFSSYSTGNLGVNTYFRRLVNASGCGANTSSVISVTTQYCVPAQRNERIECGAFFSHSVCTDSTIQSWGENHVGQLGDNSTTQRNNPVATSTLTSVLATASGAYHTVVLRSNGTVWTYGFNNSGQLGDGTTTNRTVPVQVSGLTGVIAIGAGSFNSYAVLSNGTVRAWGRGQWGGNGDGSTTNRLTPVAVNTLTNIVAVTGGNGHALALRSDGTVWGWGRNGDGQVGDGSNTDRNSPVQITSLSNIAAIAAGEPFSLALRSNGTVMSWGYNNEGELGNGTNSSSNVPVSVSNLTGVIAINANVSGYHALALINDGTVFSWGDNREGQLGTGNTTNSNVPIQVTGLPSISRIATGTWHSLVSDPSGNLLSWGINSNAQLGNGSTTSSLSPQNVSGECTVLQYVPNNTLSAAQTICSGSIPSTFIGSTPAGCSGTYTYQWQSSLNNSTWTTISNATSQDYTSGSLSVNTYFRRVVNSTLCIASTSASLVVTSQFCLPTQRNERIECGAFFSHSICMDSTIRSWGENHVGQLGDNTTTQRNSPVSTSGLTGVVSTASGAYHTVVLRSNGTVWTYGYNNAGQLGDGTTTNRTVPIQVSGLTGVIAIGAGSFNSYAVLSNGTVRAWGRGQWGGNGDGSTTNRLTPVAVNTLTNIVSVTGGNGHALALRSDGTVWGWGRNGNGQVGDGSTTDRISPVQVSSLSNIIAIGAGEPFSLALKSDGTVMSWGYNNEGELGNGNNTQSNIPVSVSSLTGVAAISANVSGFHALALRNDGTVWSWGDNREGQLGTGNTTNSNVPVQVTGLPSISRIATGTWHSFVADVNNNLLTWGRNSTGELGNGTTTRSFTPQQVMGACNIFSEIQNNFISASQTVCGSIMPATLIGSAPIGCSGNFTYQWESSSNNSSWVNVSGATNINLDPGSLTSSVYFRRAVNSFGCNSLNSNSVSIEVGSPIGNNTLLNSQTICSGITPASITGSVPTGGSGNYAYQWQSSLNESSWSLVADATSINFSPGNLSTGTYFRREVGSGSCPFVFSGSVLVQVSPAISSNVVTGNQTLCSAGIPQALTGSSPSGGAGIYSYSWETSPNNTSWNSIPGSSQGISPAYTSSTIYYRRIVSSSGCIPSTSSANIIAIVVGQNEIASSQTILYNTSPASITGQTNLNNPGYIWEQSLNNFNWSAISGSNNPIYVPGPLTQHVWYRRKAAASGCDTLTSIAVQITLDMVTHPQLIANSNSPVCQGNAVVFYAQGSSNSSYFWTGPNGFTSSLASPSISNSTTSLSGIYRVRSTAPNGDTASVTVNLLVGPAISNISVTYNNPVCEGSTLALSAGSFPWLTYAWTGPNAFTSSTVVNNFPNSTTALSGVYTVQVTSPGCVSIARTVNVTVNSTLNPAPGSAGPICAGNVINLTSAYLAGTSILWTGPSGFSSTLQNPSIANAQSINTGVYTITLSGLGCPAVTQTWYQLVNASIGNLTVSTNSPLCEGSTLNLSIPAYASSTYSWSGPNGFTGSNSNITSRSNMQVNQSGIYTLTAIIPGCGTAIRTANVTISSPLTSSLGSNSPVCIGNVISLTNATVLGATYVWSGPNGFSSSLQSPTISDAQPNKAGIYSLILNHPACGTASFTTTVQVNSSPNTAIVTGNSPVCVGNTLSLTATSIPNAVYSWTGPNGFTEGNTNTISRANAQFNFIGTYAVNISVPSCGTVSRISYVSVSPALSSTVGSNSPVCIGNVIYLTNASVSGASFTWFGPNGFSSGLQSPSISNAQTIRSGVYTLSITHPGCGTISSTTTVQVNTPGSTATITGTSPVCQGNTISMSATNLSNATYTWFGPAGFNGSASTVTRTNASTTHAGNYGAFIDVPGCGFSTKTFKVVVLAGNVVTASANTPACTGTVLFLSSNLITGATYNWIGPNGFNSTLQSPSISNVQPNQSGVYTVTTTQGLCGTSSSTVTVFVSMRPSNTQVSSAQTICTPGALTLTGSDVAGATLSWAGPSGFTASGSTFTIPSTTLASGGIYTYTVATTGCGTAIRSVNVAALSGSQVTGTVYPNPICTGSPLYLQSGFINGATYNWSGPSGFSVNAQNTSRTQVTNLMGGNYTLTVNLPGCGAITQTYPVVVNTCRNASGETEATEEVAIVEDLKTFNIEVYPNPTEGITTVTLTGLQTEDSYLAVFDLLGHQVLVPGRITTSSGTKSWELDFREIAKGVYFVKLNTEAGEKVERIVVR